MSKLFVCPTCKMNWVEGYLLEGNKCKFCNTVCIEVSLKLNKKSSGVFRQRKQSLEQFLTDPKVSQATLDARGRCNAEGHKPYPDGGQGGNGCINGCYCGWLELNKPISIPVPKDWKDLL